MRSKRFPSTWLFAAGLCLASGLPSARAATLYWDGTSTGPDADGGAGTWNATNTNWDTAATGGADVAWTDGSAAVFRGTGGVVNLVGWARASTIIFQSPGYTVYGGPSFSGVAGLIDTGANDAVLHASVGNSTAWLSKTGSGRLSLSTGSSSGTPPTNSFSVLEGKLSGALGAVTYVADGATLELGWTSSGKLSIEGAGVDGAGAIISTGTYSNPSVTALNLTEPATIGGTGYLTVGSTSSTLPAIQLESHTLTKVGSSVLRFIGKIGSPGNFDIKEGTLSFEGPVAETQGPAPVLTIRSGAMFQQSNTGIVAPWSAVCESGSTWRASGSTRWPGPVTLEGATALIADAAFRHAGIISGPGSVTKTGTQPWTVESLSTFTGGTTISAGKLILAASDTATGAGSLTGSVSLASGTFLEITKAGALGSAPGSRVSPLSATGATVETKAAGADFFDVLNLTRSTLRSNAGVAATDAAGHFVFGPTGSLNVLAADTSTLVSGRLDLGTGSAPATLLVENGNAVVDLHLQAAITQATPGRGLLKTGAGLVVVEAPATHTGGTVIQEGRIRLGALGTFASSPVTVLSGGSFGTGVPGKTFASLTAAGGSTLILPVRQGATNTVQGTLELTNGNVVIAPVLGGAITPGTYDLATASAITGSGTPVLDFSAAFGPSRATGSVAVNGNKLQLIITSSGGNLVWNNSSEEGAAVGTWDTTRENFSLDGANTAFQTYDSVTFDDSVAPGSGKTIVLGSGLVPARITVDNSNGNYTFTGTENLTGTGSLLKAGSGTLTIGGTGAYPLTGDITVAGGTVDFSGKSILIDKLTLSGGAFNNATATFNSAEFRSGSASAYLTGSAPWTKTTPGTVFFPTSSQLSGPGTVMEGTLVAGGPVPSGGGSPGPGPIHIAAGATVDFRRNNSLTIPNTISGGGTVMLTGVNSSNQTSNFTYNLPNPGFNGSFHVINSGFTPTAASLGSAGVTLTGNSSLALTNQNVPNPVLFANASPAVSTLLLDAATVSGPVSLSDTGVARIQSSSGGGTLSGSIGNSGAPGSVLIEGRYSSPPGYWSSNRLTLSGNSTYTGATTIGNYGLLDLRGSLGATAVTVTGMGTLCGSGSIGAGGSLTFQQDGRLWVRPAEAGLTVNGNVDLGTRTRVVVDFLAAPPRGPFPVLSYTGTLTGGIPELVVDALSPVRQSVFAIEPGLITLDIGSKSLVWKGQSHTAWQPGAAVNWSTDGIGETESYYDGDSVTFDDTGVALAVRAPSGTVVRPSATLFDNSAKNYSVNLPIDGQGSITKRGTGRVSLVSCSHSGGTFVEAGLLFANSLGTGPVNVSAGATLAGSVSFTGAFTCAGKLDLGLSDTSPRLFTSGPAVFSGIYECLLDTSSSDKVTVNGNLDLTGSTLAITKTVSTSNPVQTYTILTYTGNLTGTFASVTGMPEDYKLVHDAANKSFTVIHKNFHDWIDTFAGLADRTPDGDPDGDGFANIAEYVLGGNPGIGDSSISPTHELTGSDLIFRYKRRDSSIYNTTQVVQWSTDMISWNDQVVNASGSGSVYITRNGELPDDVRVNIYRNNGQKIFVRLKVTPK